jgi:hypothetical protein
MKRTTALMLFLTGSLLSACLNVNNPKNATNPVPPSPAGPGNQELLGVLDGRWIDSANPANSLEFSAGHIRRWYNGAVRSESDISVDVGCAESSCKTQDASLSDGWCFLELSGSAAGCYMVLQCDTGSLTLQNMNAVESIVSYKKIR